jgi:hypothetical protein
MYYKQSNGNARRGFRVSENDSERRHVPGIVIPFLARELIAELTPAEWKCWTILFLHSNRECFCCLKHETIVTETGIGWNAVHRAKRGLCKKEWLEICGQRERRGPNNYKIAIPNPKPVAGFIDTLWAQLEQEAWWNTGLGDDKTSYSEDHLDWLISWRVIRELKESDARLSDGSGAKPWTPHESIRPELYAETLKELVRKLRHAAHVLTPERGIWWLFGDGLDTAS